MQLARATTNQRHGWTTSVRLRGHASGHAAASRRVRDAARQLKCGSPPAASCPSTCAPCGALHVLFFSLPTSSRPSGSITRVRERVYTRHGNEKVEGFLKKRIESWFRILWLQFRPDKCGFRLVILIFGTRRDQDIGEWTLEMNRKKLSGGRRLWFGITDCGFWNGRFRGYFDWNCSIL